jgi:hypothetical protein
MILFALMLQAQPVPLPRVATRPGDPATAAAYPARREKLAADGHALLTRGQVAQAGYKPGRSRPRKAELDAATDELKAALDSMNELSEQQSLRLQMAMDRVSKAQETLSNLLKKLNDTEKSIIQNIK